MNPKKIARIVGTLYIIGTVGGILSLVFTGSVLVDPVDLVKISANENRVILGALSVLIMGFALAMIPIVVFPILKKHNPTLAVGYIVFRGALETVTYIAIVISWLLLVTLSQVYDQAVAPDASLFQTSGTLLLDASNWIGSILTIVFIAGALMFYYVLYRSKLVPRWISGWGLIAAVPYLITGLLVMFGVTTHDSTTGTALQLPLALQEMVLAVWLIVKGFNSSAITSGSALTDTNNQ